MSSGYGNVSGESHLERADVLQMIKNEPNLAELTH